MRALDWRFCTGQTRSYRTLNDSDAENSQRAVGRCSFHVLILSTTFAGVFGLLIGSYLSPLVTTRSSQANDVLRAHLIEDQYGVSSKVTTPYHYLEDGLDDTDLKIGDPHWAKLFPEGDGLVFLNPEYAATHRLPVSAPSPQHGNRSVYEIAGYHSLHCLTSLRYYIGALMEGRDGPDPFDGKKSWHWRHMRHCLADLRQTVLCNFDETLFSAPDLEHHPGQEQLRLCKKLDPIDSWLIEHYH